MIISDQARVQSSAGIAILFHGSFLIFYIFLNQTQSEENLILTQVEFLDARSQKTVVHPVPAIQPIKNVKDFLKMALPKVVKTFQATPSEPHDIVTSKDNALPMFRSSKRLVDKKDPLQRQPQFKTKSPLSSFKSKSQMDEITSQASFSPSSKLAKAEKPSLSLETVGQSRVKRTGSSSIQIDPNASLSRGSRLKDIKIPNRVSNRSVPQGLAQGSSDGTLKEGSPVRRRSSLPTGTLPKGYGRGGGGLSLAGPSVSRSRAASIPVEKISKSGSSKRASVLKMDRSSKGIEIVGPLAHRKVLEHTLPDYPAWARAKGVEAEVVIRFFVSANGEVRKNLFLERTSGYKELDQLSLNALKKWIFAPLSQGNQVADQWGIITFRFRLK